MQYPFFHCDHLTLLGFVCVVFFSLAGFASAAVIACVKAPSSSNGKLVVRGGVRSSSETCVGTFHGAGQRKDQGRAGLFH